MLTSLEFGAFLVYSPRGSSATSNRSRAVTYDIKAGKHETIELAVDELRNSIDRIGLAGILGPDVTLVPVPRSAPLKDAKALWPARLLCEVLARAGLGRGLAPCLIRTLAVPKSAFVKSGERPDVDVHYRSMRVEPMLFGDGPLTLVDDVVTKGNTILAAASRLQEAFPGRTIHAFAMVRTMGRVPDVDQIVAPFLGRIRLIGRDAERD